MRRFLLLVLAGWVMGFSFGAFDPPYWHGIVIVNRGKLYGFRFAIIKKGKVANGYDTFFLVHRPGPISPEGSYAEISFDPSLPFGLGRKTPILPKKEKPIITLIYGKYGRGMVGSVRIPTGIKLKLIFYSPWEMGQEIKWDGRRFSSREGFYFRPMESIKITGKGTGEISLRRFYFYAGFEKFTKSSSWIDEYLRKRREELLQNRPRAVGEWEGLLSSVQDNLLWMRLLQPEKGRVYLPAGRRWIFPSPEGKPDLWTIFEWDGFFNADEASIFDCALAKQEVNAVLETIYPWGNLPNWRSARNGCRDHSQPPVGSFLTLRVYLRCGDRKWLAGAYTLLKKWLYFWIRDQGKHKKRDGNGNGLLEWGSDTPLVSPHQPPWEVKADGRQRAAWESGQDDLPNFDGVPFCEKTHTLKMDCVDLSSLHALDLWSMAEIAKILGKNSEAEQFLSMYKNMRERINSLLWDGDFYRDRFWDGRFSSHRASSNFYPLLAGVAVGEMALKLLKHLKNPKEFWGKFVIPTISRDDPAFPDQQYWRGTIWPPTNYLVYQGLRRAGFYREASSLAVKGAMLFLNSWKKFGLCRENYSSITGEGGGQRYQSWGPLFALALLEDFIDISPWEGFRVSNLAARGESRFLQIPLLGKRYNLLVSGNGLELYQGKDMVLSFEGRGVLTHLRWDGDFLAGKAFVFSEKLVIRSGKGKKVLRGKGSPGEFLIERRGK